MTGCENMSIPNDTLTLGSRAMQRLANLLFGQHMDKGLVVNGLVLINVNSCSTSNIINTMIGDRCVGNQTPM